MNLSLGYFASRFTQPSIPPGSVSEYQLQLGRQRLVWLIPLADEMQGVQVELCYPLAMRAIPERLRDVSCGGNIQIDYRLPLPILLKTEAVVAASWHRDRDQASRPNIPGWQPWTGPSQDELWSVIPAASASL